MKEEQNFNILKKPTFLVGMQNGVTTLEDTMTASHKARHS